MESKHADVGKVQRTDPTWDIGVLIIPRGMLTLGLGFSTSESVSHPLRACLGDIHF